MFPQFIIQSYQHAKRLIIIIVGFTVLLIGILLIVLPGPAILVIPLGLAMLATEFIWAKRLLSRFKKTVKRINSPRNVTRLLRLVQQKIRQKVSSLFARKSIDEKKI
ncbi:MAG: PGPGW domain-containing protein [Nitrospirae bacterium]|nr:PGPGW domain-containing protein [Candidatus Troglogloeales bacterium]